MTKPGEGLRSGGWQGWGWQRLRARAAGTAAALGARTHRIAVPGLWGAAGRDESGLSALSLPWGELFSSGWGCFWWVLIPRLP